MQGLIWNALLLWSIGEARFNMACYVFNWVNCDCQTQPPSYAGENGINSRVEADESLQ